MRIHITTERLHPKLRRVARALPALLRTVHALLLASVAAFSQQGTSDADVKAAYLVDFGKFMRHSDARASRPAFDVCILGQDPIEHSINEFAANASIDNHPVWVIRLSDVTEANSCSEVFISSYEGERLREDLAILLGTDVLTVSDAPGFLKLGGMIQFIPVGNRVGFMVNLKSLSHAHLTLSSELLKVAFSVTGSPPKPEVQP
jgi:hypothetical protein